MIGSALRACLGSDRWRSLETTDLLLVRHDADCGYVHAGRAYSPQMDTIGDWAAALGLRVRSVATPYSRLRGDAAAHDPVTINRPMLAAALLGRGVRAVVGTARGMAWADARRAEIWEAVLRRARPRLVIGIDPEPSLCQAGRSLDIPVFNLQHGVDKGNESPWLTGMAAAQPSADYLPAGMLCWDEGSAEEVARWATRLGVDVHTLGHPWLARFQDPAPDDDLVNEGSGRRPALANELPKVLVSLQWGLSDFYYRDTPFNGVMADALERAILDTAGRFQWLLRLHPVQLRQDGGAPVRSYLDRTFGGLAGVEWEQASTCALPLLLGSVIAHVTDSSSVVMEAARFGVPSALLNPALQPGKVLEHLCADEREAGVAELVEQDPTAIIRWLERRAVGPRVSVEASGGRAAWMEFLARFAGEKAP